MHVCFNNCSIVIIHELKLFRETLPVALTVRFTSAVTATNILISAREKYSRFCVKCSSTGGKEQKKILNSHL